MGARLGLAWECDLRDGHMTLRSAIHAESRAVDLGDHFRYRPLDRFRRFRSDLLARRETTERVGSSGWRLPWRPLSTKIAPEGLPVREMCMSMNVLRCSISALTIGLAAPVIAQGREDTIQASCEGRDTAAIEALRHEGDPVIGRMSAECVIEGGPLDGATMTVAKVYVIKDGRGTLVTGLADFREAEATARAETIQGHIARDGSGGWLAQWQDFYKRATGGAESLAGTTIQWRARPTGPGRFEMEVQGAGTRR